MMSSQNGEGLFGILLGGRMGCAVAYLTQVSDCCTHSEIDIIGFSLESPFRGFTDFFGSSVIGAKFPVLVGQYELI